MCTYVHTHAYTHTHTHTRTHTHACARLHTHNLTFTFWVQGNPHSLWSIFTKSLNMYIFQALACTLININLHSHFGSKATHIRLGQFSQNLLICISFRPWLALLSTCHIFITMPKYHSNEVFTSIVAICIKYY